jgi:addiction module RelE/StbE family toxin
MDIKLSLLVDKELAKIKRKDKKLSDKISKQLSLLTANPKHPSLRLHKLSGSADDIWSISITMSIRMLYKLLEDDTAYFFDIGTHDEVYRK